MIYKLKSLVKSNLSLAIIVLGAITFFASNIILKEVFTSVNYGIYSVLITYFSGIYLLGILGSEQGFLRFSHTTKDNEIGTHKVHLNLILIIIVFNTFLFSFLFNKYYPEIPISFFLLLISTFSMILLLFLFNILRLNSSFITSQFYSNLWKFALFILSSFYVIFKHKSIENFVEILCSVIVLSSILAGFHIKKKIKFVYINEISYKEILISSFHFSLAIFAFTLLLFSDRFLVESKYSLDVFVHYFYLTNFYLAPYSILQNYIGFKQLIKFKKEFFIKDYQRFNRKIVGFGLFFSIVLLIGSFLMDYFGLLKLEFNKNASVILLLLGTGITRLYSSAILSAFEAKTNIITLRKSNLYILTITIFVIVIVEFYINRLELILAFYLLIWLIRSLIHNKLLMMQLNSTKCS